MCHYNTLNGAVTRQMFLNTVPEGPCSFCCHTQLVIKHRCGVDMSGNRRQNDSAKANVQKTCTGKQENKVHIQLMTDDRVEMENEV